MRRSKSRKRHFSSVTRIRIPSTARSARGRAKRPPNGVPRINVPHPNEADASSQLAAPRVGLTRFNHKRLCHARSPGYSPESYVSHLDRYGDLLTPGQWVGLGSVCKRNGNPDQIEDILLTIKAQRPDLRLHGFGIKLEALKSAAKFGQLAINPLSGSRSG